MTAEELSLGARIRALITGVLGSATWEGGGGAATQLDADGTILDVNVINDGEFLKRVGTTVVSAAGAGGGSPIATAAVTGTVKTDVTDPGPDPVVYLKGSSDSLLAGKAAAVHTHAGTDIVSGLVAAARLAAHDIVSAHSAAGLTIGHVLRASAAGAFAFAALAFTDLGSHPTTLAGYGITDAAPIVHTHDAADIVSGTIATARLGSGTADGSMVLRGDQTWGVMPRCNASVTAQTINAATTAYLVNSNISVPATKLKIGTVLEWVFTMTKTAAGTAANTFHVRLGTLGTTGDTAVLTFALPVGTAVVDTAEVRVTVIVRGPLSASGVLQGTLSLIHNLQITGFATIPAVVLQAASSAFNVTTANLIAGLSCTTAASTVLTFQQISARTINL